jgi:hypothetical protein
MGPGDRILLLAAFHALATANFVCSLEIDRVVNRMAVTSISSSGDSLQETCAGKRSNVGETAFQMLLLCRRVCGAQPCVNVLEFSLVGF